MAKMKAVQVPKAGADLEIVERDIPEPGPGHVRIRVQACGVCHGDAVTKEGFMPGITYPRVPGHEASRNGRKDSAWASAGTAGRTARVWPAGAAILSTAPT
jgi:hypothetical protein